MQKKLTLAVIGLVGTLSIIMLCVLNPFTESNISKQTKGVRNSDKEKDKIKIVVDIGHGGKDNGTTNEGFAQRVVYEKDVNLEIGLKLIGELNKIEDIEVVTTRTDDTFISLEDRVQISQKNNADLFISMHCNATADGDNRVEGLETYYYNPDNGSTTLADTIHTSILQAVNQKDRGIKKGDYQVLRESTIPAILIECGFLTNPLELEQLTDSLYQDILVSSIARGLIEYIK